MKFSPASVQQTYLIASSWANDIRCWEIQANGQSVAKAMQKHDAPILSCCWSEDGSKVFTAGCDKTAKMWDLQANTFVQIAAHDQPIRTIHYIQRPSYSCVMTGGWDRTGKKFIGKKRFHSFTKQELKGVLKYIRVTIWTPDRDRHISNDPSSTSRTMGNRNFAVRTLAVGF
jgi:WD40 repeat protein